MVNKKIHEKSHAKMDFAPFLKTDSRHFWWNDDFKHLLQKRAELHTVQMALDVGCGVGHWTREVSSLLTPDAKIIGVDSEEKSVKEAIELAVSFTQRDVHFSFTKENAYNLSFPNEIFDLVTCQTLLMHLKDPQKAIEEMLRVLKKGGKLLLVESNNYVNLIGANTAQELLTIKERIDILTFYTMLEEGKFQLGGGRSNIAHSLPGFVNRLGCKKTEIYRNDKVLYVSPPYETCEEKTFVDFILSFVNKDYFYYFSPEDTIKFFRAISDDDVLFERLNATSKKLNRLYKQMIKTKTLEGIFAGELLVIIGEKS